MTATADRPHILVVDDDPTVVEVMTRYLTLEGFDVTGAADGHDAIRSAGARTPDLIVLDLMLPGMDGLELFRRLRAGNAVPVLMLTALGEEDERITGLELGADDYVVKPFSPREVTARVRAILARSGAGSVDSPGSPLRAGGLEVDPVSRQASLDGHPLALTPRELDLLVFLMRHPGVAYRREELMEAVWGWAYGDTSTVTVHMRRLREKVEADASRPSRIQTVWGVGYRFDL